MIYTDESESPFPFSGPNIRISKVGIHLNKAIKKENNCDDIDISEEEIPLRTAIKKEIICDSGSISLEKILQTTIKKENIYDYVGISEKEIIQESSIKKENICDYISISEEKINPKKTIKKENISDHLNIDESNPGNVLSKRHIGIKGPYECGVCSRVFKVKRDFERHWMIHSGQKPYECELCQISFSRSDKFVEHKKTRKHQQKELGTWIDFESNLRVTSSGRYQCLRCDKKIHSLRNFKRHFMKHVGQRPFKCPSCKSAFVCKTDLTAHQQRHSDKRHKCKKCKKHFKTKGILQKHYIKHS